ncbi:hypothetical protein COOONC_00903 [Cooperia oncophora]
MSDINIKCLDQNQSKERGGMTDVLSSPAIKSGNVLALLNTLYTSGFASPSPSTPMLKGRTMHTLYAVSFIIYVSNCMCDWFHVWATLKSLLFFEKKVLLVPVLCMENAFAHRLDVTPYRSGFTLIWEALVDWIQVT